MSFDEVKQDGQEMPQEQPEQVEKCSTEEVCSEDDTVCLSKAEYDALQEKARKADEQDDMKLRFQAELENTKKRLTKEMRGAVEFANETLVGQLIDVLDSFDRAINSMQDKNEKDPFFQGVHMINRQLHATLEKMGLARITAVGELFDPHKHEAVAHEEREDMPDHTVFEEVSAGYLFRDRLLRPARVKVSKDSSEQE